MQIIRPSVIARCGISVLFLICAWETSYPQESVPNETSGLKAVSPEASSQEVLGALNALFGERTTGRAGDDAAVITVRPDVVKALESILGGQQQAESGQTQLPFQLPASPQPQRKTLQPGDDWVQITCRVRTPATIRSIIPDGTIVKRGDLLARLDDSELVRQAEQIRVEIEQLKAAGARNGAQSQVTQTAGDAELADAANRLSQLRRAHLKAEQEMELAEVNGQISIAERALEIAGRRRSRYADLHQAGQGGENDMEAAEMAVIEAQTELDLATIRKRVLIDHAHPLRLAELDLELMQAELKIKELRDKTKQLQAKADADHEAWKSQIQIKLAQLARNSQQQAMTKLLAPMDGIVHLVGPQQGSQVRFGQPLILLEPR